MKSVQLGNSIECDSAKVISRDVKMTSAVNHPEVGRCKKYNCKRNSEATILEEIPNKAEKKIASSLVDLGDEISGENLTVYVATLKAIKIDVINYTSRHKAQKFVTKHFTLAEISLPFHNLGELKPQKEIE